MLIIDSVQLELYTNNSGGGGGTKLKINYIWVYAKEKVEHR
jgi:hypothetical protein